MSTITGFSLQNPSLQALTTPRYRKVIKELRHDDPATKKKKFLFRLVYELHTSGNFGFRTEKYVNRVGLAYPACGMLSCMWYLCTYSHNYFSRIESIKSIIIRILYI
jgi:hypothetical protein